MALTKEELTDIDKLLGRLEKNAKSWKLTFCIQVGFGIMFVALYLWGLQVCLDLYKSP